MTRREFLLLGSAAVATRCGGFNPIAAAEEARVRARPKSTVTSLSAGEHPLGLDSGRDGLVYVPRGLRPDAPAPLALMLHGAGGRARHMSFTFPLADEFGAVVLTVDARGSTWDVILGGFGGDVEFIDSALDDVFSRVSIDPRRVGVGGFSDGASSALSLGAANGDLFTHVIAYSPGFITPRPRRGKPRVFISHGAHDEVLPIDRTSRRIVPELRSRGYDVTYREFDGPHTIPPDIARTGFEWFAG